MQLPNSIYRKLEQLGLKALVLHPLFKDEDWDGLAEILESIDIEIRRSDLEKLPTVLAEKRERILQAGEEIGRALSKRLIYGY